MPLCHCHMYVSKILPEKTSTCDLSNVKHHPILFSDPGSPTQFYTVLFIQSDLQRQNPFFRCCQWFTADIAGQHPPSPPNKLLHGPRLCSISTKLLCFRSQPLITTMVLRYDEITSLFNEENIIFQLYHKGDHLTTRDSLFLSLSNQIHLGISTSFSTTLCCFEQQF